MKISNKQKTKANKLRNKKTSQNMKPGEVIKNIRKIQIIRKNCKKKLFKRGKQQQN